MRYTNVQLPVGGANAAKQRVEPNITVLQYAVGERTDEATILHVRGHVSLPRDAVYVFAGSVKLTASRENLEHDLILPADPRRGEDFGDLLAACVLVAMDEYAEDFMMDEGKRLIEGDGAVHIKTLPLLDPALALRPESEAALREQNIKLFSDDHGNSGFLMNLGEGDWIIEVRGGGKSLNLPIEDGTLIVSRIVGGG